MGWDGIHKESKWLEFAEDRTLSGAPAPPLPSNVAQGAGKPHHRECRIGALPPADWADPCRAKSSVMTALESWSTRTRLRKSAMRQLRAAACPACVGILAHAPEDEDWRDRWGDPDFREVTRAAAERVAALSRAAADVAGAWRAGAGARLAPFLAPERQVVLVDVMALCDPSPTETCRREEKLGGARLRRRFSEGAEDYAHNAGKKITCDGRCCSLDGAGEQGDMDTRLERVCFEPDGDALRLVRIEVTSG